MANRPPYATALVLLAAAGLGTAAGLGLRRPRRGNRAVPEPAKPVELERYLGPWFEIGRYENRFERGGEMVTATYSLRADGMIEVVNACRGGGRSGGIRIAKGRAKPVKGSGNAKLKVTFFGPFFADYWVLDHDDAYEWAIVGEPSGRYLWLLSRAAVPPAAMRQHLLTRAAELGYDTEMIRWTQQ